MDSFGVSVQTPLIAINSEDTIYPSSEKYIMPHGATSLYQEFNGQGLRTEISWLNIVRDYKNL